MLTCCYGVFFKSSHVSLLNKGEAKALFLRINLQQVAIDPEKELNNWIQKIKEQNENILEHKEMIEDDIELYVLIY